MARGDTSKRLEAKCSCGRERPPPGAIDPPSLSKPCEYGPSHNSADEDAALTSDECRSGSHAQMRVLNRAERHRAVADQRGERAANPEERRPLRFPLRIAGQECQ